MKLNVHWPYDGRNGYAPWYELIPRALVLPVLILIWFLRIGCRYIGWGFYAACDCFDEGPI